jgi:hypothetical protein
VILKADINTLNLQPKFNLKIAAAIGGIALISLLGFGLFQANRKPVTNSNSPNIELRN